MSEYRSRRNRRNDDRFNVDEVLIRTDRVNVIDGDDRRRCDDRRNQFDDHRKSRCGNDHNRRLAVNADEVTILADDVFIRDDDDHDRRRPHHHNCCCG